MNISPRPQQAHELYRKAQIKQICEHCSIYNDCGYRRQGCIEDCQKIKEGLK
jgi:hypothetical protein